MKKQNAYLFLRSYRKALKDLRNEKRIEAYEEALTEKAEFRCFIKHLKETETITVSRIGS
jgi:hypothetical protein